MVLPPFLNEWFVSFRKDFLWPSHGCFSQFFTSSFHIYNIPTFRKVWPAAKIISYSNMKILKHEKSVVKPYSGSVDTCKTDERQLETQRVYWQYWLLHVSLGEMSNDGLWNILLSNWKSKIKSNVYLLGNLHGFEKKSVILAKAGINT